MTTIEERFWTKVRKSDGCWEWTGSRTERGYGQFWDGRRAVRAHRFAWSHHNGDPGEMLVCHRCDNPPCVRLDHLFLGSDADNNKDMQAKGRDVTTPGAVNRRKTHCRRGHPFSGENLLVEKHGPSSTRRVCRECRRASDRAHYRRSLGGGK